MKQLLFLLLFSSLYLNAQNTNSYEISFENAVHHEAKVQIEFRNLKSDTIFLRMSRTSPGRYALHEFAKNVYDVKVYDSKGNSLKVERPDPYQWKIVGHDGIIRVSYILYANHGDGTYSQIDETHAHLNMPATFMYIPELRQRPIQIEFKIREDLNWKVATQLKPLEDGTYFAPNLDYFMDSPTEISDHEIRSFTENSNNEGYQINFVLHHNGAKKELDTYFEKVKSIVKQEKAVFGELPDFDYGSYYFLACYLPNVDGDGMEHRNSTILTSTLGLSEGGMERNIGTVSHEFFHAWNVERIRPKSLEPFDYEAVNMSGALWFAEGFTSYYTALILCRAGIISSNAYIEGLSRTFNYVWNSPARNFFNPIEMSYQAPFVDAATSVDDTNRDNTFISYYSYGSMLGLALDLSLRDLEKSLTIDGYMKLVWNKYGKQEIGYTIKDLQNTLNEYAGSEFGNHFFESYIFQSNMPDYTNLFQSVGVVLTMNNTPFWGFEVADVEEEIMISQNTKINTPAYKAGLEKGDIVLGINETFVENSAALAMLLDSYKVGDTISVNFIRNGTKRAVKLQLAQNPAYQIYSIEKEGKTLTRQQQEARAAWLDAK
ncbi:M61 family metallopeptidase [Ascidiimonas sp. W6]|uniref:M61 family metallopeptidase n=1 Tax=Ascidiimonas meishanensis TaxID=3128903 RepID=UPI0030EEC0CF